MADTKNYLVVTVYDANSSEDKITSLKVRASSNPEEVTGKELRNAIETFPKIISHFQTTGKVKVQIFENKEDIDDDLEIDDEDSFP